MRLEAFARERGECPPKIVYFIFIQALTCDAIAVPETNGDVDQFAFVAAGPRGNTKLGS